MKKSFSLIILLSILGSSFGQIRAIFNYTSYLIPENEPYIETFLSIDPNSVNYVKVGNNYQANIEVLMVFKKDDKIVNYSKFDLQSPPEKDSIPASPNIIDIQRIELTNGELDFEITMKDLNSKGEASIYKDKILIQQPRDKVSLSGIQFIDRIEKSSSENIFTKHGYDFYPYISDFFPENVDKITDYAEIYNTKKIYGAEEAYLYNIFVEDFETERVIANLSRTKREISSDVKPITQSFDISNLPSGNYYLTMEVRNRENKVDAYNRVFFQRSNPNLELPEINIENLDIVNTFVESMTSIDTLAQYIDYLFPISTLMERTYALNLISKPKRRKKDEAVDVDRDALLLSMQRYFLDFWTNRNETDPAKDWYEYKLNVDKVNKHYSTLNTKGYITDRGRAYLKYGEPNSINSQPHEPSSYPYEIWHYYQIKDQGNVRFVFYNRDLVTNDYELLHSDARGELKDYQWQMKLQKRQNPSNDPNQMDVSPYWGGRVRDYWNNPR